MPEPQPNYRFAEFRLDRDAACLRRGEQEVDLPPKAFLVLAYLLDHRHRVVPKQELVEAIWKDTFVTDDALVQTITAIRRALGDDPEQPRYVRTKPRVGYQFIAPVEEPRGVSGPSVWVAPIERRRGRALLVAIQVGYLGLYSLILFQLEVAVQALASSLLAVVGLEGRALSVLVVLALSGVAVRLYLIATVALDHPKTGRQYRRLFPALFVFDELWALAPLLLVEATGLAVALVLVPVLVYAPLSQYTLVRSAYPLRPPSA